MSPSSISAEAEILTRVIGPDAPGFNPDAPGFNPDAARSILQLRFNDADTSRMNELAAKARQESLSEDEEEQLHAYLLVGAKVDLMHSKARKTLKDFSG
jgi:hypothetical protein